MRWFGFIAVAIGAAGCAAAQNPDLPRPAGIEHDVQFWVRVYTEVNTRSGFIHDSVNLAAVYRTVRFPEGRARRERTRRSTTPTRKCAKSSQYLADGKRDNLSRRSSRSLDLWPDDVSNAELRASSGRLRFQLGQSDRFRAGLIRSGAWRGYISDVLSDRGLPPELVALPHVESSFDPTAYSRVGAAGMWQFTRSTGSALHAHRSHHRRASRSVSFDGRRVAPSRNNYDVLQSWPLAITAYNHGQAGMRRAVRQLGTDDIETILRNYEGRTFGFASRNFYVAFLAAVQVDQNYEDYFGPLDFTPAIDSTLVSIPDYMTVATLQAALDTDRGVLRSWNPALTDAVWGGDKFVPRGFNLRLPSEIYARGATSLDEIPDTQRYTAQMPDIMHRVRSGDTISQIADRYRVSETSLVQLNGLRSRNFIRAGQVLRLPGSDGSVPLTIAQLNGQEPGDTYVVQSGDTIAIIARRLGIPANDLLSRNRISDANLIYVGQELQIGEVAEPVEAVATPVLVADTTIEPEEIQLAELEVTEEDPPAAIADVVAVEPEETATVAGPLEFQPAERIPAPPAFVANTAESAADDPVADDVADDLEDDDAFSEDENVLASEQAELAADPSDYLVSASGTIEVQALETLGHYADWLQIRTQRLRDINGMPFRQAVVIGQRLELDFSVVDRATFEQRRVDYQQSTQEAFFLAYQITDTRDHIVRRGESLWVLALRTYQIPVWLLRQFNPDLDLDRVTPGTVVKFPELQAIAAVDAGATASTANTPITRDDI